MFKVDITGIIFINLDEYVYWKDIKIGGQFVADKKAIIEKKIRLGINRINLLINSNSLCSQVC